MAIKLIFMKEQVNTNSSIHRLKIVIDYILNLLSKHKNKEIELFANYTIYNEVICHLYSLSYQI